MAVSTSSSSVKIVSDWFVRPNRILPGSDLPIHLSPWDLNILNINYAQNGLLFAKPAEVTNPETFMSSLLDNLRHSLSLTLVHFYPLAGRLATLRSEDGDEQFYTVCISCKDSPGARLVYATLDMTVSDILSPTYVPVVVHSLFDHHKAINHDGNTRPLLTVQVTELEDGVFIGCSMNHSVADGISFWHFLNSFSEIFQAFTGGKTDLNEISCPPVLERWFPGNKKGPINLPFRDAGKFVHRFEAPVLLLERIFHFSAASLAALKARANREAETSKISSFQSLCALGWRSMTRARKFPEQQDTRCRVAANNRQRLEPPLSPVYFGNAQSTVMASATVGELLENDLGWAAWKLHLAVASQESEGLITWNENWFKNPYVHKLEEMFDPFGVIFVSSSRFNKYGNEFGMGKALAVLSGYANKVDGRVTASPGREGGGSIDLEICLPAATMAALENDVEFMAAVTA